MTQPVEFFIGLLTPALLPGTGAARRWQLSNRSAPSLSASRGASFFGISLRPFWRCNAAVRWYTIFLSLLTHKNVGNVGKSSSQLGVFWCFARVKGSIKEWANVPVERVAQMAITKERKSVLIGDFKRAATDTGSPEVQIAILTTRVGDLTEHLRTHTKDYASRRGLLMMVSRRRRLLDYLKKVDPQRYLDVIRRLDIRK